MAFLLSLSLSLSRLSVLLYAVLQYCHELKSRFKKVQYFSSSLNYAVMLIIQTHATDLHWLKHSIEWQLILILPCSSKATSGTNTFCATYGTITVSCNFSHSYAALIFLSNSVVLLAEIGVFTSYCTFSQGLEVEC